MEQDYGLNRYALRENEFQRYPGHPATVNLLAILGKDSTFNIKEAIDLTPRYLWGGSKNGTVTFGEKSPMGHKNERLFSTVDEFFFQPDREKISPAFPTGNNATLEEAVDMRRFFLTAHSRAPDLNPFGQPRVSLWPITTGANRQTVYDRLIAFCSTVGREANKKIYYFERSEPLSQTADLTSRNWEILKDYLLELTSRAIPGFGGGTFVKKYDETSGGVSGEWKQILTEMFDWIRCVNLNETSGAAISSGFQSYTPNLDYPPGATGLMDFSVPGAGLVLPIKIADWGTRGAGRIPVLSEIGFRMIRVKAASDPPAPDPQNVYVALVPETFSPMMGPMPWMADRFSFAITSNNFQIEGVPVFSNGVTPETNLHPQRDYNIGQILGGVDGAQLGYAGQYYGRSQCHSRRNGQADHISFQESDSRPCRSNGNNGGGWGYGDRPVHGGSGLSNLQPEFSIDHHTVAGCNGIVARQETTLEQGRHE